MTAAKEKAKEDFERKVIFRPVLRHVFVDRPPRALRPTESAERDPHRGETEDDETRLNKGRKKGLLRTMGP